MAKNKRKTPRQATSQVAFEGDPPDEDDPLLSFSPVPHKAPRRNSITPDLQRTFIATLAATGIVTQAARAIGRSMEAIYKLRQRPGAEEFRAAWDMAIDRGVARLEDCALQRALQGEERPVVSGGKWLGTYTRHDNALLMFLLRQRRSDRYSAGMGLVGNLKPGNPVYERIRREVLAQDMESEADICAAIDAKLDAMIANERSIESLLAGEETPAG